jgi:tetratricopeptide (TPR) repeat protein
VSDHRFSLGARGPRFSAAFLTLMALACGAAPAASDCTPLARQLKSRVLDQMWGAVLEDAEKLLACDSNSAQARFYSARALDRLRKRAEAVDAYETFMQKDCRGDDNEFLCEDARVSHTGLLKERVAKEGCESEAMDQLMKGLRIGDPYSRIFTAMEISKLPRCDEAKKEALKVLLEAQRLEDDNDFRNEICLAIIRIDPAKCSKGTPNLLDDDGPSFIKVRVFDCAADSVKVSVNMPFAFARAVMESLGPEILDQIKTEGFDIENLWDSLGKMGPNQKFEMKIDDDGRCEEIEVWFE